MAQDTGIPDLTAQIDAMLSLGYEDYLDLLKDQKGLELIFQWISQMNGVCT